MMADMNDDGLDDVVGFGNDFVKVAISNGTNAFTNLSDWSNKFTVADEWNNVDYKRLVADIDNDGDADIVGFKNDGIYVAISNGADEFIYYGNVAWCIWLRFFS